MQLPFPAATLVRGIKRGLTWQDTPNLRRFPIFSARSVKLETSKSAGNSKVDALNLDKFFRRPWSTISWYRKSTESEGQLGSPRCVQPVRRDRDQLRHLRIRRGVIVPFRRLHHAAASDHFSHAQPLVVPRRQSRLHLVLQGLGVSKATV